MRMSLQFVLMIAFSCLFSSCMTVGGRIVFSGDVYSKQTETYMESMTWTDGAVFVLIAGAALCVLWLVHRGFDRLQAGCLAKKERRHRFGFACFAAICLLAAWMPYVLSVAPGIVHGDSLESIAQMLERGHPTSNHHPMFYTILVGIFLKIGTVCFGSVTAGVMLYSAFQICMMVFCIVCVLMLMYDKGVHSILIGISLAYFMFMPIFANFAVTMWKDPLFSCMLLALSVLLFVLVDRRRVGRLWFVLFGCAGLGAMIFRNNGIYVFLVLSLMAAALVRRYAKRLAVAALAAIMLYAAMTTAATRLWNVHGDFVENLGIPLQQLGYAMNNGGEFSQEDREYLYTLMPDHVWGYAYRPCLVDTIKWNPLFDYTFLNSDKGRFFEVWAHGLKDNPLMYIKAYVLETFGFWLPGVQDDYGYTEIVAIPDNGYGIEPIDLFEQIFGFSIRQQVEAYQIYIGSGTLLWLCLFGCLLAMRQRKQACAAYLPALLNWGTVMVATPVAFSLRYVYIFALGLPFYLALPLMIRNAEDKQKAGIS